MRSFQRQILLRLQEFVIAREDRHKHPGINVLMVDSRRMVTSTSISGMGLVRAAAFAIGSYPGPEGGNE
jgi:hypothetical protein